YCHPCRRHLNGALACPGCGTPVDELRAHARTAAGREAEGGAGEDADANPTVSQVASGPETDSEGIDGGLGEAAQRIAYTA
ncbi:SCO2400 family protein, partial [Streptomyces sp. NPDC003857]